MLLFLGAGASKPFGIPDMNDLTNIILKELKAKSINSWIIEEIKKKVERFGMKPDIESVLTCIDSLCNPGKGIRNAGPFAALISQFSKTEHMTYGQKKEYFENLAKETREIIRTHCFLPKDEKIADVVKVYDNLIKESLNISIHDNLFVFTTNYDYCFERYCSEKEYDPFDGFKQMRGVQIFVGFNNPNRSWKICKLHGSSNYVLTERDIIIKTPHIAKIGSSITVGRIVKESMIFPTTEKYFSGDPYFSLLQKLREELTGTIKDKERIIVIGYSFRDPAINNAFYDAFKKEKSKNIILIDPKAEEIIGKNIPELKNVIKPVQEKFEQIGSHAFLPEEPQKISDDSKRFIRASYA